MNISRAQPLLRLSSCVFQNLLKGSNRGHLKQAVRTKTYIQYRNPTPPDEFINSIKFRYEMLGAAIWWWIIWRAVMDYHVILGPTIPDMTTWTDEELGVPPLEEDP